MKTTQKVVKYIAIAFAVSLIVSIFSGIYFLGYAVSMAISNDDKDDNSEKYNYTEFDNSMNRMEVDILVGKVNIYESDSFRVETNNKHIHVTDEKGLFSVKEDDNFKLSNNREVTIYIPKDTIFSNVDIINNAGTLKIDKLEANSLNLELSAGKMDINNLTVYKSAKIEGGTGKYTISNGEINNLELEVGVGQFNIDAVLTGSNNISAGIGGLNIKLLNSKDNYKITSSKGIGSISIDNQSVSDDYVFGNGTSLIDVEGGIGSINISFSR